jgi:hypothetical protein
MSGEILAVDGLFIILVVTLVLPIWAVVDAASRPSSAFRAAGSSKALWITLIVVFWFLTGFIGMILSIVYLASIRRRVKAVMAA